MKIIEKINITEKLTAGAILGSVLLLAILAAVLVFGLLGLDALHHVQHVVIIHRTTVNHTTNNYTIPTLPGNA